MICVQLGTFSGQVAGTGTWSPLTIGILRLALYSLPACSGFEYHCRVPRFVIVDRS